MGPNFPCYFGANYGFRAVTRWPNSELNFFGVTIITVKCGLFSQSGKLSICYILVYSRPTRSVRGYLHCCGSQSPSWKFTHLFVRLSIGCEAYNWLIGRNALSNMRWRYGWIDAVWFRTDFIWRTTMSIYLSACYCRNATLLDLSLSRLYAVNENHRHSLWMQLQCWWTILNWWTVSDL